MICLSAGEGFIPNFPFGKTLRTRRAQAVHMRLEGTIPVISPVAALQQYVEAVRTFQRGMEEAIVSL